MLIDIFYSDVHALFVRLAFLYDVMLVVTVVVGVGLLSPFMVRHCIACVLDALVALVKRNDHAD